MYAVRLHRYGTSADLAYTQVPDPVAGPGQVRIAVRAAGVHLLDTALVRGDAAGLPFPLPDLPLIPGREVAGVVDQVGEGVDGGWLGRRVVTHLGLLNSGYAELVVREVDALFEVPAPVGFEAAVAMVGTGRTAMSLLHVAELTDEDVVLVPAAAGGVGSLLVQAAANGGATVVALAGGHAKLDRLRGLGVELAVDYHQPQWPEQVRELLAGREVTVVLDGVGGGIGRSAYDLLAVGGRMILFGWSAGEPTWLTTEDLYAKLLCVTVALGPRLARVPGGLRGMQELALAEAAAGRLVPLTQAFALKDAAASHDALLNRRTVGKVVLVP